jgi:hypothetical protein
MTYSKWNSYLGWLIFVIASAVYLMTIESTASLWDCGEYITAAYKLEVGHPPGAPLFMVLGRLFSFFAAPENVAVYINALSAISSSLTILFMFWSLTLLIKKIVLKQGDALTGANQIAIFSAASIGSLAYTFSDSFWFSAVEGEVYAMASLFTAVIFWAILKWDEEMEAIQHGSQLSELRPNRWLLLIFFMLGLAIGVHLLGILVVPAIGYMIYFRTQEQVSKRSDPNGYYLNRCTWFHTRSYHSRQYCYGFEFRGLFCKQPRLAILQWHHLLFYCSYCYMPLCCALCTSHG